MRNFSRIDTLEAFDSYNINDGLKDTLIIANNSIKYSANITAEYGDMVSIDAIGGQINQVLLNMVLNAADAVKTRHDLSMGSILIKTYIENHYVVFSIKDDGIGIDDEHMSSLFNPFYTTKPVGKGLGLGLSMSYDIIVNKHLGQIEVTSVINEGTEFVVYLPIESHSKSAE